MKKTVMSTLRVIFYIAVVLLVLTFVFGGFERFGKDVRRPAYEEGYERGYDAGKRDGYEEGYSSGYDVGCEDGYDVARQDYGLD